MLVWVPVLIEPHTCPIGPHSTTQWPGLFDISIVFFSFSQAVIDNLTPMESKGIAELPILANPLWDLNIGWYECAFALF